MSGWIFKDHYENEWPKIYVIMNKIWKAVKTFNVLQFKCWERLKNSFYLSVDDPQWSNIITRNEFQVNELENCGLNSTTQPQLPNQHSVVILSSGQGHDETLCNYSFRSTACFWLWHRATISHGTLWSERGKCGKYFSWIMTEKMFPDISFLIQHSEPFCCGKARFTNAIAFVILADRNFASVSKKRRGWDCAEIMDNTRVEEDIMACCL